MGRIAIPALILIVETVLAAHVAVVVWLLAVWMVDDSQAARMVPSDWYIEAVRRFAVGTAVGFVFGAVAYLVNRRWVAPLAPNSPSLALRAALLLACCIGLAGGVGAIQFAVTKPFM